MPSFKAFLLLLTFAAASRVNRDKGNAMSVNSDTSQVAEGVSTSACQHTQTTRPVHLLVTRHGLSCANIVDKFSETLLASKMHVNMKDPLLSDAGLAMTASARKEVDTWLENKNLQIDAVLSSSLARALETAAVQYNGHEVYSVPHIRESGLGKDNQAKNSERQIAAVAQQVHSQDQFNFVRINHEWVDLLGGDKQAGDWQKFKDFLRLNFLPNLVARLAKPDDEPLVLAIVTHSNFMMQGEVKAKCSSHYPIDFKSGQRKANNNQVVSLTYNMTIRKPDKKCHDSTTSTLLEDSASQDQCESVGLGSSIYDSSGSLIKLCKRELGKQCVSQIASKTFTTLQPFVEDMLRDNLEKQAKVMRSRENIFVHENKAVKLKELDNKALQLMKHTCLDGTVPDFSSVIDHETLKFLDSTRGASNAYSRRLGVESIP